MTGCASRQGSKTYPSLFHCHCCVGYYTASGFADDLHTASKLLYGVPVPLLQQDVRRLYRDRSTDVQAARGTVILTFLCSEADTWGWVADVEVECTLSTGMSRRDRVSMPLALVLMRVAASS